MFTFYFLIFLVWTTWYQAGATWIYTFEWKGLKIWSEREHHKIVTYLVNYNFIYTANRPPAVRLLPWVHSGPLYSRNWFKHWWIAFSSAMMMMKTRTLKNMTRFSVASIKISIHDIVGKNTMVKKPMTSVREKIGKLFSNL